MNATRFASSTFRVSSAGTRVLVAIGFALLAGVGLLLVLPIIFVAGVVLAVVAGIMAVRAWLFREHAPNGMLDGRRNVRVRAAEEADAGNPPSDPP